MAATYRRQHRVVKVALRNAPSLRASDLAAFTSHSRPADLARHQRAVRNIEKRYWRLKRQTTRAPQPRPSRSQRGKRAGLFHIGALPYIRSRVAVERDGELKAICASAYVSVGVSAGLNVLSVKAGYTICILKEPKTELGRFR